MKIKNTLKTIGLISACFSLISCDGNAIVDGVLTYYEEEEEANNYKEEQDFIPTSLVGLSFETFIIDSTTGKEGDYTRFHFTDELNVTTRYDKTTDFSTYTYDKTGLKTFVVIITSVDEITGKNQINTLNFSFESQDKGSYKEYFRESDSDVDEYHEGIFAIVPVEQ